MSYSAFVVCRCYQDGKIVDPPFKEHVHFDADGLYLHLPEEVVKEVGYETYGKFEDWKETACEHEDMEVCSEFLCNNVGMY